MWYFKRLPRFGSGKIISNVLTSEEPLQQPSFNWSVIMWIIQHLCFWKKISKCQSIFVSNRGLMKVTVVWVNDDFNDDFLAF